jgi:histidinol-phosphate/aromatic aminotransferase/cobyric acid decarboxylase-like protein/adenosyl cobinamide kinase/adenosyl cobinamide phosphate guanylyltransferase
MSTTSTSMGERIVVIGGTRSGKSGVAERLAAERAARGVVYVATGAAGDPEMAERVEAHRARRPAEWATVETPDIGKALAAAPPHATILVDNLAGWLADRMTAHGLWAPEGAVLAPLGETGGEGVAAVLAEAEQLWEEAGARPGATVLVADESGLGPVPPDPSTRRWLDLSGSVVQRLAAQADQVLLVVAGRPLPLPAPIPTHAGLRVHGDAELRGDGRGSRAGALLDFAVNVHDGPASPSVEQAVAGADVRAYPDETSARRAVAARHGRAEDEVLPTAGAAEAFWLLAQAVRARRAVCVHPSFTEPEAALRAHGILVEHVYRSPARAWALEPSAIPEDADLVVVGNPNNPTGTLDPAEAVASLCRPGRITLVDEAFMDFTPDEAESLAGRRDLPGLVVTRSVTKLWGLAGLRAGYLLGPPGLVARLAALRQPWSVSAPALAALEAAAGDEEHRRAVAETTRREREALHAALDALPGVRVWHAAANFLLVRVPDGPAVHRTLRERGVAVRPSTFPGLDTDHLRVAVRGPEARERFVTELAAVLSDRSEQ